MTIINMLRAYILEETKLTVPFPKLEQLLSKLTKDIPETELEQLFASGKFVPLQIAATIKEFITINETFFFRHPDHFKLLQEELKDFNGRFDIFSGGCSTGQETYSLAMLFHSMAIDFNCTAIDVSPNAIALAKAGIYTKSETERTPEEFAGICQKYLIEIDEINHQQFQVRDPLKARIQFSDGDLFRVSLLTYDLIFCRNILIYFNEEDRNKILTNLVKHLRPARLLFIGAGEILPNGCDLPLKKIIPGVYRKVS